MTLESLDILAIREKSHQVIKKSLKQKLTMKTRRKHIISCAEAKQITISDFLKSRGYKPKKDKPIEVWFHSPFRLEQEPSFKVCKRKNVWFDHGAGIGGTIIDLIMKLQNCSIPEALLFLSDSSLSFSFHQQPKEIREKEEYSIKEVGDLKSPKLIRYVEDRKINPNFALKICKEVHYTFDQQKIYQGVGFKNDSGGFEIRYHNFKCCLVKKNITTILNHSETACFFESWSDFLSYLTLKKRIPNEDFIILNSTALIKNTEVLLQNYKNLKIFFDNDNSGKLAFEHIQKQAPNKAINCSAHYADFKDLNEYLISL